MCYLRRYGENGVFHFEIWAITCEACGSVEGWSVIHQSIPIRVKEHRRIENYGRVDVCVPLVDIFCPGCHGKVDECLVDCSREAVAYTQEYAIIRLSVPSTSDRTLLVTR